MLIVGRGLGDTYTPAKLGADVNRVIADLQARIQAVSNNAELYKVLRPELDRAHQFQTTGLAPSTLAVRVAALTRVRDAAKVAYDNEPGGVPSPTTIKEASEAASDILRWYAAVSGQVLAASNADADTVRKIGRAIKDAPRDVVGWALESARDAVTTGLGLPGWLIPVALVGAGLLVVAPYAAPLLGRTVAGYTTARRTNPRRRRAR